jgi:flagellar motor protein MotB
LGLSSLPSDEQMSRTIFFGRPYVTISKFADHSSDLSKLPPEERRKIQDVAELVINSHLDPGPTGGLVVAIGMLGYADKDLTKSGKARTDSEQQTSVDRAEAVAKALTKAIVERGHRLDASPPPSGDPYDYVIEGRGANNPVKAQPTNEAERALNRRVDIFLIRDTSLLSNAGDFPVPPQKSFG